MFSFRQRKTTIVGRRSSPMFSEYAQRNSRGWEACRLRKYLL